ncbi:MAG TPA: bifunctional enoyl-CoA hydratase/phosphate acetyltransferase [Candidatus Dormibacteraeota bacterium]|nr:bifunctional enoyl-CoA hydratase/phosphate acetyltransferase [Candidatus Dormibacteraeota bacterium]
MHVERVLPAGWHADLLRRCEGLPPARTAVVHPCDVLALEGAVSAARAGLIVPVLVGNEEKIRAVARDASLDVSTYEIVSAAHSHAAAAIAVQMARAGNVEALMKGSLHSDELLHEVTQPLSGLHTERRMSHAFLVDVAAYPQPLVISDAVVNIAPTLDEKRDIVRNAVDLAHAVGIADVRVALLAAVETVSSKIQSTLDAAALCKMAERGQIPEGLLDGPLALDDALSPAAAMEKKIHSLVAGRANVLIVPDIDSGNVLVKALSLLAHAALAGVVLGARVPIALASRADNVATRVASAAVALLLARAAR